MSSRISSHRSNNGKFASEIFVDHESKESQHSGTSFVKFNATFEVLLLLVEGVPSKFKTIVTEITNKFAWLSTVGRIQHHEAFKETNEGKHLEKTGIRNCLDGGPISSSRKIDLSWKTYSVAGNNLAKEGKHTDAAVLDLDITKMIETILLRRRRSSKSLSEGWTPSSLSKEIETAEEDIGLDAGAKAAADPARRDAMLSFMITFHFFKF